MIAGGAGWVRCDGEQRSAGTMREMSETALLAGFPVVTEIAILWGDEDSFGHVNNVA